MNTSLLQVKARYPASAVTPIPNTSFVRPTEAVAMANGKLMVRLREAAGAISGTNFVSNAQMRFGAQNPVIASATGATQLQTTSPLNAASGPVNLTAYFSNGWLALAPPAFSFGPKIEKILPNSGSLAGGDTVTILGYGFGTSPEASPSR